MPLNLNALYRTGLTSCLLKEEFALMLRNYIDQEQWSVCDEEGFLIPNWMLKGFQALSPTNNPVSEFEKEKILQNNIKRFTPECYFKFFQTIFNSPLYNAGLDKLHNSKLEVNSIELWNGVGSGNNHWHWDGPGNADVYALVYLTDYQSWPQEFGGGFKYGVADRLAQQDGYHNVHEIGVFCPDNGRIVLGDNRNPLWVHKTIPLTQEAPEKINRFTFLVSLTLECIRYD